MAQVSGEIYTSIELAKPILISTPFAPNGALSVLELFVNNKGNKSVGKKTD